MLAANRMLHISGICCQI